jgi:hydrogenase maturation protease
VNDHPFLVLGIGNCLMGDDGIGVHAARALQASPPPATWVVEIGTDFFSALLWLPHACKVLAIDAMDAGGAPGTIYRCRLSDTEPCARPVSLHQLGLLSILEFLRPDERPQISVLGVQPERIAFDLELSAVLQQALPQVGQAPHETSAVWASLPPGSQALYNGPASR